jgi:SAM-dependent methyltransferase
MPTPTAADREYALRLIRMQRVGWKRWLRAFDPYRWDLRRLKPGFTLEVGCGIGRNLRHLNGHGIGLDRNAAAVAAAREIGLRAFTPEEFRGSVWDKPESFDSLLLSHVAEHMRRDELEALLRAHLGYVRGGGQLILITPQEVGFRSDPTHVEFMDFAALRGVAQALGLVPVRDYSFPFPRPVGRVFIYNQFISVSRKP